MRRRYGRYCLYKLPPESRKSDQGCSGWTERLKQEAALRGAELEIVGSCSTGYGEELIKAAFGLDSGIIETMAHERAAASLMPDVSFILDIGGQDMKAIFVEKGAVVRMELNEACSSGCGTFIQTFANNMGYSVGDFAQLACQSKAPCDLGTRCTVFMNSKVKQVLREGASVADISAGISYSVIKNCLYKVLKLHGNENLGGKIVVQGGTMRNDAVVRAFELLTHTEVARSNMPELMGAYGCAFMRRQITSIAHLQKTSTLPHQDPSMISRIWLILKPNNCNAKAAKTIVMFPATPLPAATDSTPETSVSVCLTTREQTG